MSDRVKITKLPTANGNMPLTDEEKADVINDATFAYEKFLDALRIDWRKDPNSDNTPRRVAKAYVNDIAAGCYNELPNITAFPSDGYDGMVFKVVYQLRVYALTITSLLQVGVTLLIFHLQMERLLD